MLIIRRIDVRSFLRTALPALVLAEIPLLLVDTEKAGPAHYLVFSESPQQLEAAIAETANVMLLVMALNLLYVIAGTWLTLWVYNVIARRHVALTLKLQPVGGALRLRRVGVARALAVGLLLSGFLAALAVALSSIPLGSGVAWIYFTPLLLELNLVSRLLADIGQFRIFLSFYLFAGNSMFSFLIWAFVSGASALAGGALFWLGATLYNGFAGRGGEFALRLRAARQERRDDSATFTAQLRGIHLSRARGISFRIVACLLPFLLLEAMARGPTPAFLLSILRLPLALMLFNRIAPRAGGLIVECERATPADGGPGQGAE